MAIPKLITVNPCKGVKLPQPDDEEIVPLSAGEIDTLLQTLGKHRNAALYHIAIRLGLRRGELLGLRWKDIDLEKRTLTVAGQLRDKEKVRTNRTKRKSSQRTLKIEADDIVDVIQWHLTNQTQERDGAGDSWNEQGLVFCSENGTAISPRNLDRQFKALLKRAGLREIRFHDLRHTYATHAIAAGVDLFTLHRRMGHSSIVVTADRYGHLISS